MALPIQITVGGSGPYDPAVGETEYNNPTLLNVEFYIEEAWAGTVPEDQYEIIETGGFRLLDTVFMADGLYFVHLTGIEYSNSATSYTNGFCFGKVMTALFGRVGWKQPTQASLQIVNNLNRSSKGGRYFNDFHALCTIENIKATCTDAGISDTQFNTLLENQQKAVIMRCLNGVFPGRQVIDQVKLFSRYGYNDELVTGSNQFVGYEINVADKVDAAVQIDALHLYFDSEATFNIYLFKDGNPVALWTEEITTEANAITEIPLVDKVIGRGKYYLGYFQADIGSAKAYQEQVECWNKTLWFSAIPVECDATGATTFNRNERSYPYQPKGLNLEMSSFKDYTRQIENKAAMFDELIGLTNAYATIEQIIYAVRSSSTERILKDELDRAGIQLDLTGAAPISDGPKVQGLRQRIERELKNVQGSFYPKEKAQIMSLC